MPGDRPGGALREGRARSSSRMASRSRGCRSGPTRATRLCGAAAVADLAEGAVVGTSSLRRRSQLLALRPDLDVREVRGNVDTRLGKLAAGDYGALVLARAGLVRLGRSEGEPIPEAEMTPAPGRAASPWRHAPTTERCVGSRRPDPPRLAGGADRRARGGHRAGGHLPHPCGSPCAAGGGAAHPRCLRRAARRLELGARHPRRRHVGPRRPRSFCGRPDAGGRGPRPTWLIAAGAVCPDVSAGVRWSADS